MKVFLVEMHNNRDSADDEVIRVKSKTKLGAQFIAYDHYNTARFSVGRAVPARGGKKWERELASDFRLYCINKKPITR